MNFSQLKYCISLLFVCGFVVNSMAQSKDIYVYKRRYDQNMNQWMRNSDANFKNYEMISRRHIDPKRNNETDYDNVEKYLKKYFPQKDMTGTLVIDLENKFFKGLKKNEEGSAAFEKSKKEFVTLIKFIRKKRPCLTIGVYGMPFRIHKKSQNVRNENGKLDPILKLTDIIFPSIYIFYPAKQKSVKHNLKYFKMNLDMALDYGKRLNKPVVPFMWYLVHTSNEKYKYEALGKEEMAKYLDYIINYQAHGKKVTGIAWWEANGPYNEKKVKTNMVNRKRVEKNKKQSLPLKKREKVDKRKFDKQSKAFDYYKSIFEKKDE